MTPTSTVGHLSIGTPTLYGALHQAVAKLNRRRDLRDWQTQCSARDDRLMAGPRFASDKMVPPEDVRPWGKARSALFRREPGANAEIR